VYTVYSKPACPHCDQAKALLKSNNLPFTVVNLDVGQPKTEDELYISREDLLSKIPTARTMPQIFKEEAYIGGFSDLKQSLS
jgi:glutaredoxin 3